MLSEPYYDSGPGRPYYSPEAIIKALMLQRFLYVPSERILAERLLSVGIIGGFAVLGAIRLAEDASPISGGNASRLKQPYQP